MRKLFAIVMLTFALTGGVAVVAMFETAPAFAQSCGGGTSNR